PSPSPPAAAAATEPGALLPSRPADDRGLAEARPRRADEVPGARLQSGTGPRRAMSTFVSRIVVALVLLPLVIGLVYLGGWPLFGLALVAGLIALHELYTLGRADRPLVLAGFLGFVLALLGAQLGGLEWMAGGLLATFVFAFLFFGLSHERPAGTRSFCPT